MGYCGVNDIRKALTGSAQAGGAQTGGTPTNTAADLDDDALQDSISEATSIVDAYLNGPYDPTTDTIPDVVGFWTRDVAAYLATLVFRKSKDLTPQDPVVLRYQSAITMLEGVAAGTIDIPSPSEASDQPSVVNVLPGTLFDRDDFDLTGRRESLSGSGQGFRIVRSGGILFWRGD